MKAKALFVLMLCMTFMGSGVVRQTVFSVSGRVVDTSGRGVEGVVVNNGRSFTATDATGRWVLMTDTLESKYISITTPADYCLPSADGLAAGFFVPVSEALAAGGHDFVLERRTERADSFYYIAISDPQVRGERDMGRWLAEAVPDIRRTVDSLRLRREVVGVALGDMVFDNMPLFEGYAKSVRNTGMTLFHCIGNHDFDKRWKDLDNMRLGTPVYAEMEYNRRFGPTDYSFNIGKAHVVTMKNIDYLGGGCYVERMTERQLEWLEKDLSYVPKGSLVILNMHAAGWNAVAGRGNMRNARRLAGVLRGYRVHVFCGHTHFFQNVEVTPELYQHNIGAVCGAWWAGSVNCCGAPNGYLVVEVDGDSLSWHYKSTGSGWSRQLDVYGQGEFLTQKDYVVANVWDYDTSCRVEWLQDGKFMGVMERFTDIDQGYSSCRAGRKDDAQTSHLFRCRPRGCYKEITVVLTNRFGERFSCHI